jgi:DNA-binding NarL/FixJ family response regulator
MSSPIKVLLADDSDVMRRAIRNLLRQYPNIELVGEAVSFAQTIQMMNDLKPQVILMDLHMKDQATFTTEDIKTQLNGRIVAISLANDEETKALADSFGALILLDKMELAVELIPTIEKFALPDTNISTA